jgi:hypothetical protein
MSICTSSLRRDIPMLLACKKSLQSRPDYLGYASGVFFKTIVCVSLPCLPCALKHFKEITKYLHKIVSPLPGQKSDDNGFGVLLDSHSIVVPR